MRAIHSLITNLRSGEVRIVRSTLSAYTNGRARQTKTLMLFDYLLKKRKRCPGNAECCMQIYGKQKDVRFKMLKSRLKSKILDALNLDLNIDRRTAFDPVDHHTIKIRKRLSQLYRLYFSKAGPEILSKLLGQIIETSKQYESYGPLTEALKFKKYSRAMCRGEEDFNRFNREIEFYEQCSRSVSKANDYYYRLIMRTDFYGKLDPVQMQRYLDSAIRELTNEYVYTRSAIIGYFLKLLEIAYHQNNNDYIRARRSCHELLSIVENNKAVYRHQRIGTVYLNLCQMDMHLNDYAGSLNFASLAQRFFPATSHNHWVAREHGLYALFYIGNYDVALRTVEVMMESIPKELGRIRLAKLRFFQANVLFMLREYRQALRELGKQFDIARDKEGWNISIRLLSIMALTELERYDEAALKLENLRRHAGRNMEREDLTPRYKLIMDIFFVLEENGFDFRKLRDHHMDRIAMLESTAHGYEWSPLGSEIVPFHRWIKSIMADRKVLGQVI